MTSTIDGQTHDIPRRGGIAPIASAHESTRVTFTAGEVIFSEGEEPDCLYVVIDGRVKISCSASDGRTRTLTVMGPLELFGEVALLDGGPRTATATAITDVRATALSRAQLRQQLGADPAAAMDLLRIVARRVRRTSDDLIDLLTSDATARVSKHLLDMAQQFGVQRDGGIRLELGLNQEQFAQMVGTSRETVNKTFGEFVAAGWIRIEREAIFIVDSQPLSERTHGVRKHGRSRR